MLLAGYKHCQNYLCVMHLYSVLPPILPSPLTHRRHLPQAPLVISFHSRLKPHLFIPTLIQPILRLSRLLVLEESVFGKMSQSPLCLVSLISLVSMVSLVSLVSVVSLVSLVSKILMVSLEFLSGLYGLSGLSGLSGISCLSVLYGLSGLSCLSGLYGPFGLSCLSGLSDLSG